MEVLIDLFFKFPWNNFLHAQVELCIANTLKLHSPEEQEEPNALTKHVSVNEQSF